MARRPPIRTTTSSIHRFAFAGTWHCLRPLFDHSILLIWCSYLFAYGLGAGTLYRTEALRAIIGREALHGSWLAPTLYGEPYLTKPPGMYVAIAVASAPFGDVTTVSARIPAAVAATITVLLFFGVFQRVADRRLALAAAMLMPVSFLWLDKAPSAEIDMLQVMWLSAGLVCFLKALEAEEAFTVRARSALTWWLLALLCVTAGFLTKWTAPAFYYLAVVPLLARRRRLSVLFGWRHLASVACAIGLVVLWASAVVHQVGWSTLRDTVLGEAAQRFAPKHAGQPYPWFESLTFPFVILGANLPWSLLALFALRPAFFHQWDENGRRVLQLLHCWTWPNLIFWSLPAQHHVRYALPMCPGLVGLGIMVGISWARGLAQLPLGRLTPRAAFAGILIAWCAVKFVYVEFVVPQRTGERRVTETAARLNALVPTGDVLYLCKLKDEGVLFYYHRPARRFRWEELPGEPSFHALLIEAEWEQEKDSGRFEVVECLRDQQGAPIVLVRRR